VPGFEGGWITSDEKALVRELEGRARIIGRFAEYFVGIGNRADRPHGGRTGGEAT